MSGQQSPHHYSLRPSERRMLAQADLIFWVGPTMESFMPRILDSLKNKQSSIALIETQNLKLLPLRQTGHDHGGHDHDDHGHDNAEKKHAKIDPHFWLNTHNADVLVDAISQKIIQLDPEHKEQYLSNSQQLHQQIAQLRKKLHSSLNMVKKPFLTYHDGYQYFEDEFNLDNAGFIATSELQPSARRIAELKTLIQQQNIECIFYDAPTKPTILKSLLANAKTNTFMLDPVGLLITRSKNAWFEIMQLLNRQFIKCQQNL